MKLTERHIQNLLWNRLRSGGQEWMCPNLHVPRWFGVDFFSLTKAGMMVEHEIKLSVSDFRADSRKESSHRVLGPDGQPAKEWVEFKNGRGYHQPKYEQRTKHSRLALGDTHGPRLFWYVCPDGMLKPEDVPSWAGLKWATFTGIDVQKQAPRLHATPVSQAVRDHLHQALLWRYWCNRGIRDGFHDPGGPIDFQI